MEVKIKVGEEYLKFHYNDDLNITVISLLEKLGNPVEYSCSCLQGICGACTMVINSEPKLACKTFLNKEQMTYEYDTITIEPLSKFPLIKDLKVDRSILYDSMKNSKLWLESNAKIKFEEFDFEYDMSLCILCGCCCEACPNYDLGNFVGPHIPVSASKLINQENDTEHLKAKIPISTPANMKDEEFENRISEVAESFGNNESITYMFIPIKETQGNCNTSSSTIL